MDVRSGMVREGSRSRALCWSIGLSAAALGIGLLCCRTAAAADAILSWSPNAEPDVAGYRVHYGTAPGIYSVVIDVGSVTSYAVTGLGPGTYYFALTAYNQAGAESGLSNEVSKTIADTQPPLISAVAVSSVTTTEATVTWTTNEPATSWVEYGTGTGYGLQTTENVTLAGSHLHRLTGLQASTTYHFRVLNRDAAGNLAVSADRTFTTLASDTTPPTLSSVAAGNVTSTGTTITWLTNEPATSQVQYGLTTAYGSTTTLNGTLVTAHSQTLSGLAAATTYHFRVLSRDAAGNLATSVDFIFTTLAGSTTATPTADTTAPVISNVAVVRVTSSSAIITWTTSEPATTQVEYGVTTAYGSLSGNTTLVQSHSQLLTGLARGTTYHFRVRSIDAAGNTSVTADQTFRTARGYRYGRR